MFRWICYLVEVLVDLLPPWAMLMGHGPLACVPGYRLGQGRVSGDFGARARGPWPMDHDVCPVGHALCPTGMSCILRRVLSMSYGMSYVMSCPVACLWAWHGIPSALRGEGLIQKRGQLMSN